MHRCVVRQESSLMSDQTLALPQLLFVQRSASGHSPAHHQSLAVDMAVSAEACPKKTQKATCLDRAMRTMHSLTVEMSG